MGSFGELNQQMVALQSGSPLKEKENEWWAGAKPGHMYGLDIMYVCISDVEGFLLCLPDALMDLRSNQILA